VVGAAHDDATHAFLQRDAVDVVGERDVGVLGLELGVAVVLPGVGGHAGGPHEAAVDDGVGAAEVLAIEVAIGPGEIGHHDPRNLVAVPRRGADVDRDHVPALVERLEHALGDVARGSGEDHTTLRHHFASTTWWR
jgi:hypothetical protein